MAATVWRLAAAAVVALCALSALERASADCWFGINYSTDPKNPMGTGEAMDKILGDNPKAIKIFKPDEVVFKRLQGKSMELIVGADPKELMTEFAKNLSAAPTWVAENILPWADSVNIVAISVANEKLQYDTGDVANHIVDGMWSLYYALRSHNLEKKIKILTPQTPAFVATPIPPSRAEVRPGFGDKWKKLLDFVTKTDSTLAINAYPWFIFKEMPHTKDFALFKGFNGYYDKTLYYQNTLDQTLDGVLTAAEKLGYPNVKIMLTETGWPTGGEDGATAANAQEYFAGLMDKVCSGRGTPKRPHTPVKTFIFEAFDEAWKIAYGPSEPFFGYYDANGKRKFSIDLNRPAGASVPLLPPMKWCRVKKGVDAAVVAGTVDWACKDGGVDCNSDAIKKCARNPRLRANAVYNAFFQMSGQHDWACNMSGTAKVSSTPPSTGPHQQCVLFGRPAGTVAA